MSIFLAGAAAGLGFAAVVEVAVRELVTEDEADVGLFSPFGNGFLDLALD